MSVLPVQRGSELGQVCRQDELCETDGKSKGDVERDEQPECAVIKNAVEQAGDTRIARAWLKRSRENAHGPLAGPRR